MASRSVNKVILVGRIGKDAETRFLPNGSAKTTFSVATEYGYKDKQSGEWRSETTWSNIVLWRSESLANYLTRGTQVYVEGRLSSRSYDDKDGTKKYVTEVVAENVILLGGKPANTKPEYDPEFDGPRSAPAARKPHPLSNESDLEVPF